MQTPTLDRSLVGNEKKMLLHSSRLHRSSHFISANHIQLSVAFDASLVSVDPFHLM